MAIETVTTANLAEYVGKRITKGSEILTPEQATAAAIKREGKPEPVKISTGEEKSPDAPPDPGRQEPTAKTDKSEDGKGLRKQLEGLLKEKQELDELAQTEYEGRLQAQRRIDELERQLSALAPKAEPEPELKLPDPKSFTDQAEYDKALKAYQDQLIDKRVEIKLKAERERERQAAQEALMRERVAQAEKDIPDFREVISQADRAPIEIPDFAKAAIMESDIGPQLAYHLAKNPDEAKRIFGLTPAKALLALGKIETQYAKTEKEEAKASPPAITPETTRAPAPMTPLKDSAGTVPADLSSPMNFKEYRQRRMEEIRRNKRH